MSVVSTFFRVRDPNGNGVTHVLDEINAVRLASMIGGTYEHVTISEKVEQRSVLPA